MKMLLILLFIYIGRVCDPAGTPLPYTTVYSEMHPEIGTATGPDGRFVLDSEQEIYGDLIFSFIGYKKASRLAFDYLDPVEAEPRVITLEEQPLALEEMVVSSKRQRNKRKMMKELLAQVWTQMQEDFPAEPIVYEVVSDVRLDQDSVPWGVEQLIARSYEWPRGKANGRDSVLFFGMHRKRYMYEGLREKADAFKRSEAIERMDAKGRKNGRNSYDLKWTVQNVDSGVVVHRSLWTWWDVRSEFADAMKDPTRHWSIDRENEGETVLTCTEKKNYLGIFKYEYRRHFILDSGTLSVRRFSQQGEVWVNIPFGYKLNKDQLVFLNLLNMSNSEIERFRLKKAHATILLNSIYTRQAHRLVRNERNLHVSALLTGSKKSTIRTIPIDVKATQRGIVRNDRMY